MMKSNRKFTKTGATANGLDSESGWLTPETREEIELEQLRSKNGYMRCALELKQLQVNGEIEKVESSKCKLAEVEAKILKHVDEAELILSGVMTLAE